MTTRFSIKDIEPDAYKAMYELENYITSSEIPEKLRLLIKIRASQINGCAYCIDMHTEHAIAQGESDRRLFALSAWKESHLFTEEERIVLQLTEEVTLISIHGIRDETYASVRNLFSEKLLAQIIMQIVIINTWNRIAVAGKIRFK